MRASEHHRKRVLASIAIALVTVIVACGSDKDNATKTGTGSKTSVSAAAPTGTVEQQLDALLKGFEADYKAGDGAGYCAALTEEGRREVASYARLVGEESDCASFIATASRKVRELGITQKPSRIISVRAQGRRAVAMISIDRNPPRATKFVNVDGQWKFVTAGFINPGQSSPQTDS